MISAEQYAEWKTNEVTIAVFAEIAKAKKDLQERLSDGQTLSTQADITHGMTNKVVGQIEGLNQLLNISYESEDIIDEVSNVTGH